MGWDLLMASSWHELPKLPLRIQDLLFPWQYSQWEPPKQEGDSRLWWKWHSVT